MPFLLQHAEYLLLGLGNFPELLDPGIPVILAQVDNLMYLPRNLRLLGLGLPILLVRPQVVSSQLLSPVRTVQPCPMDDRLLRDVRLLDIIAVPLLPRFIRLIGVPRPVGPVDGIAGLLAVPVRPRVVPI